ncbi:MAG: peptide chain release factor N(5)-glutamine methyltransferase [Eubacteriales bacterium]|nr:peptide chain release factor N(5)-glutamine methyltransferase [Eubacteriales bacterium]
MPRTSTTISDFVREAGKRLQALPTSETAGEARREAREILRQTLGLDLAQQYAKPDQDLSEQDQARLQEIVERRLAREPLSAILGYRDFYGHSFQVPPGGLAPRPETELLVDLGLRVWAERDSALKRQAEPLQLAELCCGSGAPGLSLLRELQVRGQESQLLLLDLDPLAVSTARMNAQSLGLQAFCSFQQADLFPQTAGGEIPSFDLIMVNPPYIPTAELDQLMPEVRGHEKALALDGGEDGLDFYRRLASKIRTWLRSGAWLIMEHGEGQREAIQELFALRADQDKLIQMCSLDDYGGHDRVLALQYG